MELSRKSCRICVSETDFNVSLFGNYARKTNMVDKILVCLKIVIEETDFLTTICYKCAENIEKYYDFVADVKKCQSRMDEKCHEARPRNIEECSPTVGNRRHVTSYVREQVFDADYTFSFLEPNNEEKKERKTSSPFFSYFSPPNVLVKQSSSEPLWKTPRPLDERKSDKIESKFNKKQCKAEVGRHHSRDLFESQSQEVEDLEPRSLNWRLTPDDNIIKRVREKCFGRSDF